MADESTTAEQVQENSTQQDTTSGTTEKTFTQAELEAKYTAISKGVKAENVEDVIVLAMGRVTDTVTLDQAIDSVIKKYPSFSSSAITTGVPSGGGTSKISGVEAAFLARNPGLKI